MDNRPIGVFDSGLGGLSTVNELYRLLPNESIVYFGDTGRVPYGTRSRETIVEYARQDEAFLISKGVKMIIAACGTVSTVAPHTGNELPVPFVGVMAPAVNAAAKATKSGRIGVIGTSATIRSGAYEKALGEINSDFFVISTDCPLFVPIVEQGWIDNDEIALLCARRYLEEIKRAEVDTLILGCTHYPLIADTIKQVMGENVTLISPSKAVAEYTSRFLTDNDILCEQSRPYHRFYVSDRPDSFMEIARTFIKDDIFDSVEQIKL